MNDQSSSVPDAANNYLTSPYVLADYFSSTECEAVIAASEEQPELTGNAGQVAQSDELRNSSVRFIAPTDETAWIYNKLQNAVLQANNYYRFNVTGIRERLQVAGYKNSGHYTWHIDIGKDQASTRKLSISVQLSNDSDYTGGDLEFFSFGGLTASRSIGSAIIFPSYLMHRVTPVTSGTRRSLVLWVHGQPFS